MADIGLRGKMLVKDVMSSPVVAVEEDAPANKIAGLMDKNDLGCIIVTDKGGKPLGIITERDLVTRVLSKNAKPDSVEAKEVMTSPLVTIEPDETISEAARRMSRLNVRRLGVVYKGNLIGVVSSKDVLAVMPELIEIIQERTRIEEAEGGSVQEPGEESTSPSGYCDHCGIWSDNLQEANGEYVCEDCGAELGSEE